jgi:hypothetical protein
MFKRAYKALSPRGWFETQDIYFKPHSKEGPMKARLCKAGIKLLPKAPRKSAVIDGAFANMSNDSKRLASRRLWHDDTYDHRTPSPRGKRTRVKVWTLTNGLGGPSAPSLAMMTKVLGMSPEAVELGLVDLRRDMKDESLHMYYPM